MNTSRFVVYVGSALLVALLPLAPLYAGDDVAPVRPVKLSMSAEMNEYLLGQKVAHTVETTGGDGKGEAAESLTVKIYGVTNDVQQDSLCATLGATAKKGHAREATVLFFESTPSASAQQPVFRPSELPSGNGGVEFARDARPSGFRLLRTVKL